MTSLSQIQNAITELGIKGSSVVVHASMKSFGQLEGGTAGLIQILKENFKNVMMPAFSTTFITRPPDYDHLPHNGCDYDDIESWKLNAQEKFDFSKVQVDKRMGLLAQDFSKSSGVFRSHHPWHGWSASGPNAESWTRSHSWKQTHPPLQNLIEEDGWVILMGVDLRSCTAIHIAEEIVGRSPFVRWAVNANGEKERIYVSGCAKGFHHLEEKISKVIRTIQVGDSLWKVARARDLVLDTVEILRVEPQITLCSPNCIRCNEAISKQLQSIAHIQDTTYHKQDHKQPHVGIITYQFGHLKTFQIASNYLLKGFRVSIYGFPFKYRPSPIRDDRPSQLIPCDIDRYWSERNCRYIKVDGWKPENCQKFIEDDDRPDYYMTCISKIIPKHMIDGRIILNTHPGILPENRGVDAIKWGLLKEMPFGVTLHIIDAEIDRGIILARVKLPVFESDNFDIVCKRLYDAEIHLFSQSDQLIKRMEKRWMVDDRHFLSHDKVEGVDAHQVFQDKISLFASGEINKRFVHESDIAI